ncbi:MAG: hypothetical protein GEV11_06960 [Streptosporangiales bacterium]|nr:hypothetical protein [Streptosporangiales bacterium]
MTSLKKAGYLAEVDHRLLPSGRLADRSADRPEHLLDLAGPTLNRLRRESGLSVALTVRVHTAALCLDTRRSGSGYVAFHPGEILPLHAGASATPLLAPAPEPVRRQVLNGRPQRFTAATPAADTLATELETIRRQGHHVTRGWVTPGMAAVGVPVTAGGRCVCALSLVGTDGELADPAEPILLLRAAADELGKRLEHGLDPAWTTSDSDSQEDPHA